MASLHTGSPDLNESVELLCIETNLFTLYIKGKPFHPTVESMQLHRDTGGVYVPSHFHATSLDAYVKLEQIKLFSLETGRLEHWNTSNPSHPLFYETQSYEFIVEKKEAVELSFYHANVNLRNAVKPLGHTGCVNYSDSYG